MIESFEVAYVTENSMIGYLLDVYSWHIDDEEDSVSKSIIRIDSHIWQRMVKVVCSRIKMKVHKFHALVSIASQCFQQ